MKINSRPFTTYGIHVKWCLKWNLYLSTYIEKKKDLKAVPSTVWNEERKSVVNQKEGDNKD